MLWIPNCKFVWSLNIIEKLIDLKLNWWCWSLERMIKTFSQQRTVAFWYVWFQQLKIQVWSVLIVSTEAASRAIVELLEVESGVDNGNGWLLLNTINLLSLGGQALIDCMTAASLPSTLVKCLYLLFDLPPVEDSDTLPPGCQFSPNERRVLLQKVFVQVRTQWLSKLVPVELFFVEQRLTSPTHVLGVTWVLFANQIQ